MNWWQSVRSTSFDFLSFDFLSFDLICFHLIWFHFISYGFLFIWHHLGRSMAIWSHLGPAGGHRPLSSHKNEVWGLGFGAQGWGANDALAARRTTISMFPDCDSSNIVIDFHDHVFINNETAGAGFLYQTNVFSTISQRWMFRNVWKSIEFNNPGPPKRHKYHNSWKQNTL